MTLLFSIIYMGIGIAVGRWVFHEDEPVMFFDAPIVIFFLATSGFLHSVPESGRMVV